MRFLNAHRRTGPNGTGKVDPKGKYFAYGSIASFNRWTHKPHEHNREVARNLRREFPEVMEA
jgi:hypothetical protein